MPDKSRKKEKSNKRSLTESRVREEIRYLSAYSVPHIEAPVKLDGNESPFSLPPEVGKKVIEKLSGVDVNRYPDPEALALRELISRINDFPPGGIILGNGSDELIGMLVPRLQDAGLLGAEVTAEQSHVLDVSVPLVQERCTTLSQAVEMLRFLFCGTEVELDEDSAKKTFKDDAAQVLDASIAAVEGIEWTTAAIEEALKAALVDGMGLKPRKAYGPVRVAISGKTVSPPLYESMELLGKDVSLARLRAARATL